MLKILTTAFVATCLASCAATNDKTSNKNREIDTEQFCYYADMEYSEGAVMDQDGSGFRCVRAKDSKFRPTVSANTLVWQRLE